MRICEENHGEVCYDAGECPVCQIMREFESKIEELNHQIEKLEEEIAELSS